MKPATVGTRVRVLSNQCNHNYVIGRVYTVISVDSTDNTFRAVDESGKRGNWLRWDEVGLAGPSTWARIAADLPDQLVKFLSCFQGISDITLKETVLDSVLAALPETHERITAVAGSELGRLVVADNSCPNSEEK